MGDDPTMQLDHCAASIGGEHEWQHGVNQARESGPDQRESERGRNAEVLDVRFTDRGRMLAKHVEPFVHGSIVKRRPEKTIAIFNGEGMLE